MTRISFRCKIDTEINQRDGSTIIYWSVSFRCFLREINPTKPPFSF